MTKKLYDEDSHIRQFKARVVACQAEGSAYRVELDQTAFFAEGGGQASDRGRLGGQTVLDVQEQGDHIYHVLPGPLPVGSEVEGEIDWAFRFDNMQQHSGEHILSGLVYALKGYHNVGFHMNESLTTIDFDGPLTQEELEDLEQKANQVIYENEPVRILYPGEEELQRLAYRSKKELSGRVRIVALGSSDLCACCAPHVKETGEVGALKIVDAQHYKGGMRLTILCGARARGDYAIKHQMLRELGAQFSVAPLQVQQAVLKEQQELQQLKSRIAALSDALIEARAAQVAADTPLCLVEPALDTVSARKLVNALVEKGCPLAAVLLPKEGSALYQYVIGSGKTDVRPLAKTLSEQLGGRGGGSAAMIQGTVTGAAAQAATILEQYFRGA